MPGRTRTAPTAMPERLRFAFASCQHFEQGLFTAYDHMAKDDLDLVIHRTRTPTPISAHRTA